MVTLKRATKDTIVFLAGLGGVIYETVVEHVDRPWLLAVFASMLGLNALSDTIISVSGGRRKDDPPTR